MLYAAGLAMHRFRGTRYLPAKGRTNRLMSKTYAQNGQPAGEMADQIDTDASLLRSAGAGRNHDPLGTQGFDFADTYSVVAADLDFGAQLSKLLNKVVGE